MAVQPKKKPVKKMVPKVSEPDPIDCLKGCEGPSFQEDEEKREEKFLRREEQRHDRMFEREVALEYLRHVNVAGQEAGEVARWCAEFVKTYREQLAATPSPAPEPQVTDHSPDQPDAAPDVAADEMPL